MKLGIFTDSHYSSKEVTCTVRYNSKSLEKIRKAYSVFEKENCDLIICLGDLIDKENSHKKEIENLKKVTNIIKASPIPFVCIMGNHDGFAFEQKEFYEILGGCEPENIFRENKNLLFLDACYFKSGAHYMPGDSDWEDTFYPFADSLEALLPTLSGDSYIFMHQNLDPSSPPNHRLSNADRLCEIVEKSGKVKTVFQGHYHLGSKYQRNNVEYITYPAMCQNEEAWFVVEI